MSSNNNSRVLTFLRSHILEDEFDNLISPKIVILIAVHAINE
jgi:hypothetical protein